MRYSTFHLNLLTASYNRLAFKTRLSLFRYMNRNDKDSKSFNFNIFRFCSFFCTHSLDRSI